MYSLRNISGNEQIKLKATIYVDTFSNGFVNTNVSSNINDTDLNKEIVSLRYNMLLF